MKTPFYIDPNAQPSFEAVLAIAMRNDEAWSTCEIDKEPQSNLSKLMIAIAEHGEDVVVLNVVYSMMHWDVAGVVEMSSSAYEKLLKRIGKLRNHIPIGALEGHLLHDRVEQIIQAFYNLRKSLANIVKNTPEGLLEG